MLGKKHTTKRHTKSRSPQYNEDNESSGQVGSVVSEEYVLVAALPAEEYNHGPAARSAAATFRPRSNGSSSTETGTSDTLGANDDNNAPARMTAMVSIHPGAGSITLTEHNLQESQREDSHRYIGSIPLWVEHAGGSLAKYMVPSPDPSLCVHPTDPSTTSSVGRDWQLLPTPSPLDNEVMGAGAWCDTSISPEVWAQAGGSGMNGGY